MNISNVSANTPPYQPQTTNPSQVTRHPDHDGDADDTGAAPVSGSTQPESAEGGKLNAHA